MPVQETVQAMSDRFHKITNDLDAAIGDIARQLQGAGEVRQGANISGQDSQRTFRHLSEAMTRLVEARGSITLAHSSAQKEAERADVPWDCPDALRPAEPVQLRSVNG